MSQKLDLLLAKNPLQRVDGQTVLMKTAEHLAKMLSVRGLVGARNQNITEVDKNERQTSQKAVHHALERGTWVAQTKGHVDKLEEAEAEGRDDGGLGDVVREHLHLVVPLDNVEGGEHMGTGHVVRYLSGTVALLSRQKSSQGRQELSGFCTM